MANNALFVFITGEYDVKHLASSDGTYSIVYTSHRLWKTYDVMLKDCNVQTYVFMRKKHRTPYQFCGKVIQKKVVCERSIYAPLSLCFTINLRASNMSTPFRVFPPMPFAGVSKYKKGVYMYLNVQPISKTTSDVAIVTL